MPTFFHIETIAFQLLEYSVSYVELLGTLCGLLSVYWASRTNILTWPIGIANEVFFFLLFYQIGLYPDMFLQVYFLLVTLYGWWNWRKDSSTKSISKLTGPTRWWLAAILLGGTLQAGFFFSRIHMLLPQYFAQPSSFPYIDSFIMLASIVATVLLARKKVEAWVLWIGVDVVATLLYFQKGVYLLSIEYLIFLSLACYGYYRWNKQVIHETWQTASISSAT